jgi:hypothetical protein
MKQLFLILIPVLLTGCLKQGISPVATKNTVIAPKTDSLSSYDWFNGTTGTALVQVTCTDCTAIATIGDVSTPFIFNAQGVGQLKYTPAVGLSVYIAVCPDGVKPIKADIFDKTHASLYSFAGNSGNWNYTYIVK